MAEAQDIIDFTVNQQPADAAAVFNELIGERIAELLAAKREDMAKSMFGSAEGPDEDGEDEDDTDVDDADDDEDDDIDFDDLDIDLDDIDLDDLEGFDETDD